VYEFNYVCIFIYVQTVCVTYTYRHIYIYTYTYTVVCQKEVCKYNEGNTGHKGQTAV